MVDSKIHQINHHSVYTFNPLNSVFSFKYFFKIWSCSNIACVAHETKLWLSPSAKQRRNPCSRLPLVNQYLSTHHVWPVKNAIVDLPFKMKGNSKRSCSNSLTSLGAQKWISVLLRRGYFSRLNYICGTGWF